jgi:hypothetical protein
MRSTAHGVKLCTGLAVFCLALEMFAGWYEASVWALQM